METLSAVSVELPTEFKNCNGRPLQEWDGVLLSADTLYLLEAKHSTSVDKLMKMAKRVNSFPETLARFTLKTSDLKFSKVVRVACGTRFPKDSPSSVGSHGHLSVW